jgi:hypothetical protein
MNGDNSAPRLDLRSRIAIALKDERESESPNEIRLATLRLMDCAIHDRDVCALERGDGTGCPDAEARAILEVMIEQRETAQAEHKEAGRTEEARYEAEEIAIIESFLPARLEGGKLTQAIKEVVTDLEATRLTDLGRCMNELKARYPEQVEAASAGKVLRDVLCPPKAIAS